MEHKLPLLCISSSSKLEEKEMFKNHGSLIWSVMSSKSASVMRLHRNHFKSFLSDRTPTYLKTTLKANPSSDENCKNVMIWNDYWVGSQTVRAPGHLFSLCTPWPNYNGLETWFYFILI
jgi:hypothetical protein